MADMIDLAYTPEEQKERDKYAPMPSDYNGPKYPWGLSVTFDKSTLAKLGKSARDFNVGDEVVMEVKLRVTSISAYETESSTEESVGLTMVAIAPEEPEGPSRAERLYPGQGK